LVPYDCEISLESNPGTIDGDKLRQIQSIGMNRLSVGVQSLDNEDLRFLGRRHNVADAVRLIQDSIDLGLRVSADFIYGLPGQTAHDVENLCGRINKLGLRHCSMYELSIEPGTPLSKMNLTMPRNEEMAAMYEAVGRTLELPRYEVSNYAAPGQECRHNQNVWDGRPYIGIGPGAAGRPFVNGIWYEQTGAFGAIHKMDPNARALEKLITGMRTIRGVALTNDVRDVIDWGFAVGHPELVQFGPDDKIMSATPKGMLILDDLLVNLAK
jgi:oxygen-independent coproporphyrinogen-3 oxidase